jgi:hypothetical protein
MSLHADNTASQKSLLVSSPAAGGVGTGAYTVGILYKRTLDGFPNSGLWTGIQASDFTYRGILVYLNDLYPAEQANGGIYDANLLRDGTTWYWIVASKGAAEEGVRFHVAVYNSSGSLTWAHGDGDLTSVPVQPNHEAVAKFGVGNPFGAGFSGDWAVMAAYTNEMADVDIEDAFERSAQTLWDAGVDFMIMAPEVSAASPLTDLKGGTELSRSSGWTVSPDPAGFDFAVDTGGGGGGGGDTTAPSVPTGLSASSIAETSFVLSFSASSDDVAVAGYQYSLDGGSTVATATSGMTISGLVPNNNYSVRVRAYDASSNVSAWSTPLPVTTLPGNVVGGTTSGLKVRVNGAWITVV